MEYSRRQEFNHFYSGQFRPYWSYKHPGQPSVLVVHVPVPVRMEKRSCFEADIHAEMQKPKSRAQRDRDFKRRQTFHAKKSTCAMMPFYGLDVQDFTDEIQNGAGEDNKLTIKLRKTSSEWNTASSLMPGSELSDREFQKLFFRPASLQELSSVLNDTLAGSLKVADAKIKELQDEQQKLQSEYCAIQKRQLEEMDQSRETLAFHHFNNEMLRRKIEDLEERNRQLHEANDILNSACERLISDKEQLTTTVQSCLENLDSYKRKNRAASSTNGKVISGQNDNKSLQLTGEIDCEWCCVVRAFYRVCSPT